MREPGFYWVEMKTTNSYELLVANWDDNKWFIPGTDREYKDSDFSYIRSKPIEFK